MIVSSFNTSSPILSVGPSVLSVHSSSEFNANPIFSGRVSGGWMMQSPLSLSVSSRNQNYTCSISPSSLDVSAFGPFGSLARATVPHPQT